MTEVRFDENGEGLNSQDFADYYNESRYVEDYKSEDDSFEDDCKASQDGELEADWLERIGLQSAVTNFTEGKEVEEEPLGDLLASLTQRQAQIVRSKIATVNATIRKRRYQRHRPNVRDVFPQYQSETSSSDARSRSATPDSLDSLSPTSATPPSPSSDWEKPSLDSGHHPRYGRNSGGNSITTITIDGYSSSSQSYCRGRASSQPTPQLNSFDEHSHHVPFMSYSNPNLYGSSSGIDSGGSSPPNSLGDMSSSADRIDKSPSHGERPNSPPPPCMFAVNPVIAQTKGSSGIINRRNLREQISSSCHECNEGRVPKTQQSNLFLRQRRESNDYATNKTYSHWTDMSRQYRNADYNSRQTVVYQPPVHLYSKPSILSLFHRDFTSSFSSSVPYNRRYGSTEDRGPAFYNERNAGKNDNIIPPRRGSKDQEKPSRKLRDDKKKTSRHQVRYNMLVPDFKRSNDSGVQILGYNPKGTLYGPRVTVPFNRPVVPNRPNQDRLEVPHDNRDPNDFENKGKWDFELSPKLSTQDPDLPDMHQTEDRLGITSIVDLAPPDMSKAQTLAQIWLDELTEQYQMHYARRKATKRRKKDDFAIFGVPLKSLLERDRQQIPECKVPLVLDKMIRHLRYAGLEEEGILRVPGSVAKIQHLRQVIEAHFYDGTSCKVDEALRVCSVNDVATLLKQFLRELPVPLLTNDYIKAFLQVDGVSDKEDQVRMLKLLVLTIPEVHRNTLRVILDFLAEVVEHEQSNRMNLQNVAMIMAPNLFPPCGKRRLPHRPDDKGKDLALEINMAAVTCRLVKMMVHYRFILWTIPPLMLVQIRKLNKKDGTKKPVKESNGPMRWLLPRKSKAEIFERSYSQSDYHEGKLTIYVRAPQFHQGDHLMKVTVTPSTTAGAVVWDIVRGIKDRDRAPSPQRQQRGRQACPVHQRGGAAENRVQGRQETRRALSEIPVSRNVSCFLSSPTIEKAKQSHALCEVGGNISERKLSSDAVIMAVHQENPNAEWMIRCLHGSNLFMSTGRENLI